MYIYMYNFRQEVMERWRGRKCFKSYMYIHVQYMQKRNIIPVGTYMYMYNAYTFVGSCLATKLLKAHISKLKW